jgi:hypothetical protein
MWLLNAVPNVPQYLSATNVTNLKILLCINDLGQCFSTFSKSRNFSQISFRFSEPKAPYSTIYNIFREPSEELAEPLGSAEPRLKNTDLGRNRNI